jgi:hypothetical protein
VFSRLPASIPLRELSAERDAGERKRNGRRDALAVGWREPRDLGDLACRARLAAPCA